MTFPKARLVVSGLLFVGWIAYLGYLVSETWHQPILSRPQLHTAELWVGAEVNQDKDGTLSPIVMVKEVFTAPHPGMAEKLIDQGIFVTNLRHLSAAQGWAGDGLYLLPLNEIGGGRCEIATVPPSPGYEAAFVDIGLQQAVPKSLEEPVAQRVAEFVGIDHDAALALIRKPPALLGRGVPRGRALAFAGDLHDLGVRATIFDDDVRIYPLTPQVREQLKELQ